MTDDTYDCVIIGQGLAGTTLAWQLLWQGARVLVIDREDPHSASRVAAGLMTPVTGQRLVLSWRLAEFWPSAGSFYRRVETETASSFLSVPGQVRILSSELEHQRFQKRDPAETSEWIVEPDPPVSSEEFLVKNGSFEIPRAARLDVSAFLDSSRNHFQQSGIYSQGNVDPAQDVGISDGRNEHGLVNLAQLSFPSKHVVFCQGFAGSQNRWFKHVEFDATRGEILTVRIPGLRETRIINGGVWIIPLGDELFRVGATYDWSDLNAGPTDEGREEICQRLRRFLRLPFDVVDHSAGIRPIVVGRHPVLGFHPEHPQIGIFNGLGSKGSLQAPLLAEQMAKQILKGVSLKDDVDVASRFKLRPATILKQPPVHREVRLTERAHAIVGSVVKPGETTVDATAGNGHDTCFLARLVGETGSVFAFDRQSVAIERTSQRLRENGVANVNLLEHDHSQIEAAIPQCHHGEISAVMFNLGYLPGGDKSVITRTDSTLPALNAALNLVRRGGVVTVLAYPGHAGGDEETAAVENWLNDLDPELFEVKVESVAKAVMAPRLFVVHRLFVVRLRSTEMDEG